MPTLRVSTSRLRHNLAYVKGLCDSRGVCLMGVVKGCHAHSGICRLFAEAGIAVMGAARVRHASPIAATGAAPWMVALPPVHRAMDVVRHFPVSFNSEAEALEALSRAAAKARMRHEAMLMVEVGDLREGVMPGQVVDAARRCLELEHEFFGFKGLAAHFGCLSGLIPTPESVERLIRAGEAVEAALGRRPETLSVGGSDFLRLLEAGPLHPGISQVRMGYAVLQGKHPDSLDGHPRLAPDAVLFEAEVLEVKDKPSMPFGITGINAFGERLTFVDRGVRKRAVLGFGALETESRGLTPALPGMELIGFNSNYSVYDVSDCPVEVRPGQRLRFRMNYKAMALAFHSGLVDKVLED
ncbi:MAG: alanine racemase [Thermodesulfobacteriota bacterium]